MAFIADAAKDAALDYIAAGTELHLCSSEPATYGAVAAASLGSVTLTAGDGNGDWTIADGDTSGRKLTLAAQTVTGSADGTATHYAITRSAGTELLATDTMTNVAISNGVDQDTNAVDVCEIADPA